MSILNTLKKAFNIQSATLTSADGQNNSKSNSNENNERDEGQISEPIEETPLFIRGNREDGYFIILGNYKVTKKIDWLWKAREIGAQTDWQTIMNVAAVMIEIAFKIKEGKDIHAIPTEQ